MFSDRVQHISRSSSCRYTLRQHPATKQARSGPPPEAHTSSRTEALLQKFPEVFKGLGKLKNYQFKIHADTSINPVAQPYRRLPSHIGKQVEDELDRNKLLLQWRGPYEITRVISGQDYGISVDGREKIFHPNLLKWYVTRGEASVGPQNHKSRLDMQQAESAGAAVIEPVRNIDGAVNDEKLLDLLPPATGRETCEDVRVSSDLTDRQRREVNELMREFTAVLDDRPGMTHLAEHEIEVTTNKPVRVKQYPMPYSVREAVNQEVSHLLEMGVVEAAKTPYNAPVVLVKKADGTNRFCVSFQGLNAVTKFVTGPMPNQDDILAKLGKDVYFSKVDLSKGFWQIPMAEGSRQMTGFTTDQGTFTFLKMPFGLVNSGATFSRMMRKLLKGLDNVDNYVDGVIVHTQTWEQHLEALRGLLTRLRDAGLTARPTKSTPDGQKVVSWF